MGGTPTEKGQGGRRGKRGWHLVPLRDSKSRCLASKGPLRVMVRVRVSWCL